MIETHSAYPAIGKRNRTNGPGNIFRRIYIPEPPPPATDLGKTSPVAARKCRPSDRDTGIPRKTSPLKTKRGSFPERERSFFSVRNNSSGRAGTALFRSGGSFFGRSRIVFGGGSGSSGFCFGLCDRISGGSGSDGIGSGFFGAGITAARCERDTSGSDSQHHNGFGNLFHNTSRLSFDLFGRKGIMFYD